MIAGCDAAEYVSFRKYIYENPVKRGLADRPAQYPYSSASGKFALDGVPQRLKPEPIEQSERSAEALLHP
jgi:hypothetical protein